MVLGNLLSTWFDGRLFMARAPDHVGLITAARVGVLIAVVSPGVVVQWWPKPRPFAWALLGGCALVAAMQAVIAYEYIAVLGDPPSPFWFGFFAFLAITVFPVPLRFGLANATVICLAQLLLHTLVIETSRLHLAEVVTLCVLTTGMGAALSNRMHRSRRHEHALLARQQELTELLQVRVEERSQQAAQLLEDKSALEGRLAQAQRLEALGRLAGGVAHDLNNLLTPIMVCADIARRELGQQDDRLRTLVAEILTASERARDLVQQLLAFGRRQTLERSPIALDRVLWEQYALFEHLVGERVSVQLSTGERPAVVEADRAQLIQVLTNLAANASDAMPDGGTLRVRVGREQVSERGDLPPGDYVVLSVSDTGCGMDENTRELIFEPFFTTKQGGHSGLGLATVYGIVQQHGGAIRLRTSPGEGTEVNVYFRPSAALPKETPEQDVPSSSLRDCTGSALLVEDDDEVRRLVQMLLRHAGFRVLAAASGRQALALAQEHTGPVRLVVADIVMPGLTGLDVWAKLRDRWPEAKVLFVSGYSHDVIQRVPTAARTAFLAKPFTAEEFERKLRALIEASPSEPAARAD